MRYRKFGRTAVQASEIGFGAWTIATDWWGEIDRQTAVRLLQRAYDIGITLFDTGDTYGKGLSEEILGEALAGFRDRVTLATKFGYDIYTASDPAGHRERPQIWDPSFARHALEQSLRRLGTDYVDLYQLHNPRLPAIQRDDLFELLERLVEEGKIRAYGVALGPAIGWEEEGVTALRHRRVASVQTVYNMMEQDPGRTFFREAQETGAGVLVRVPLHSGLLEGNYSDETTIPAGSHRLFRFRANPEWLKEGLAKVAQLDFLTRDKERTLAQTALKFCLMEPTVTSVLPTVTTMEQLEEFAAASDLPDLTSEEMARIRQLYESDFQPARAQA